MSFDNVNVIVSGPIQPTSIYKTKVLKGNHPFASQVTEPNMKYIIKYDFDLGGAEITIPEGCLLEFDGGSLHNGTIILSEFCNILGNTPNKKCLFNVKIKLNKCCDIQNIGIDYTNLLSNESIIEFKHSEVTLGRFYSIPNILIQNIRFDVHNTEHNGTLVSILADVETDNVNAAGCSGFIFRNIDFYGTAANGFVFDGIYSNSWINNIVIDSATLFGVVCGWKFNTGHGGKGGSCANVSIINCSFQWENGVNFAIDASNLSDTIITGNRFWDYKSPSTAICRFDTGCWSIVMSNAPGDNGTIKPYIIDVIEGQSSTRAAGSIFIINDLVYTGNITKYLSPSDEVTVKDLYNLPNGLYYLPKAEAVNFKNNWGVILGNTYAAEDVVLSIDKKSSILTATIINSKRPSTSSVFTKGCIQSISTRTINDTPIKDLWNIYSPTDKVNSNILQNINAFVGESRFVENTSLNYLRPFWFDGTNWIDALGYKMNNQKGAISNAPSDLGSARADLGFPYFVIYDNGRFYPTWWNGSKFIEADMAKAGVNRSGTFADKPSATDIYIGFRYFCTDRQTTEGATNGIEIIHKGNNVWVDALGRVVS